MTADEPAAPAADQPVKIEKALVKKKAKKVKKEEKKAEEAAPAPAAPQQTK